MSEDYTDYAKYSHWGMFEPDNQSQYSKINSIPNTVEPVIREGSHPVEDTNWKDRYDIIKKKLDLTEQVLKMRISALEQKCLELENKLKEETPLWKQVFEQTTFHNGHGQMTLGRLTLSEIKKLLQDMQDNVPDKFDPLNDIFYLSLFLENDGSFSGNINQSLNDEDDRLWLSIHNVVIDETSLTKGHSADEGDDDEWED